MNRSAAVIEDEGVLRESVAALLSSLGYRAEAFENALQFLQAVECGCTFDLCVVDINLPGVRGDDLLIGLGREKKLPNSVVLFLSGLEEQEVRAASRRASSYFPSVQYACKPVRTEALIQRIDLLAESANG